MDRTLRIGIFSAIGVALIVGFSIYVNDHPFWYRPCNPVKIHVDDATGLRRKSPVRTLGLDIGYINEVGLEGDQVLVTVCVTGPVKLNSETRAYIRSAGFLGDKFLELKPVELLESSKDFNKQPKKSEDGDAQKDKVKTSSSAPVRDGEKSNSDSPAVIPLEKVKEESTESLRESASSKPAKIVSWLEKLENLLVPRAEAAEHNNGQPLNASRELELQDTVKKVGKLIDQLTLMVGDLREVTQQKDFKETVVNLNAAMKHLELLLRPTGKVMKNVDAALESLKNTMANAEKVMEKVNNGEGTIGKLINDPSIFDEMRAAVKSVNLLLGKAGTLRTFVDIGGQIIHAYGGNKANFSVMIAPNPTRYYLVGISSDPRGRDRKTTTTTAVNNGAPMVEVKNVNEEKGLRITAMFGKYFGPLDLRIGFLEDYGAVSAAYWFDEGRRFGVHADLFAQDKGQPLALRGYARAQVWSTVYVTAGFDNSHRYNGKIPYFVGAGLFFDDDDLKYLLAFK